MPFGLLSNRGLCIRYPRAFGVNHQYHPLQLVQSLFSNKSFSGCESGSAATKSMASSCSVVAAPADLMVDTSVSNYGLIKPSGVFFGDRMRRRVQLSLRSYHGGRPYLVYNYEQSSNKSALFSSNGLAAGCASCYSDGIVPQVSTDGSLSVEQLTTAPLSATQNPSHISRKLLSGACYLPHPAKEETGGEDAHFICADEQVIGVADGVGGWADVGVNAGEFSRELMRNSVKAIREVPHGDIDLLQVLEKAHKTATAMGSSTACIVALKNQDLHAINLGDSGFIVVRDGSTIFESPVQQHGFNFTYQLEKGNRADLPSSGQVFKISVVAGDVVVAGTDGLFDNLSSEEVAAVVGDAVKEGLSPDAAAEKIAAFARVRALDRKHPSPFSKAAQQAGFIYYGGKLDDLTVVVSYVSP